MKLAGAKLACASVREALPGLREGSRRSKVPWPGERLAPPRTREHALVVSDVPIERAEVVALLFNVSDIAVTLTKIERLLGEDDGEEETDED